MKCYLKKLISLCLMLLLIGTLLPMNALAAEEFMVTGYTVDSPSKITKGSTAKITVKLRSTAAITGVVDAVFVANDSFSNGTVTTATEDNINYTLAFDGLKYTGVGNTLSFAIIAEGIKRDMTVSVSACKPYVEPTVDWSDDPVEPKPAPKILFDCSEPEKPIAANETADIKVTVINYGTGTPIKSAILTLEPAGELMIFGGQDTHYIKEIKANSSVDFTVTVTAAQKITTQSQSILASLSFDYYNNVSDVTATAEGKLILPSEITPEEKKEEEKEPEKIANPVPLIILSNYSYGGSSVAAGAETNLSLTFRNTSKTMSVENVMLTVNSGTDLTINGSTNTFYFDVIGAGGTKSVTVPLKAVQRISGTAQDVRLSFSYEYVDRDTRGNNSSEMSVSVPLYQPDRFEISDPVAAYVGFVGEETSLTMDYVNKGRSEVSNVEARIEGDVDCYNNFVRVGNLESGKSGTIAFAVTPMLEGDNQVKITITYEDTNGDVKERVFETTLSAMAQEPFDPGEWEDPTEPVDEGNGFPWWILVLAAIVLLITVLIVVKKKKKKAKLQAEQALWDEWDEDNGAEKAAAGEKIPAEVTEGTEK